MPIADSNPERRNLLLLAWAINIYYLAGGEFNREEGVRLNLINVHFHNPHVLVIATWITLAWFTFRFWQANKSDYQRATVEALEATSNTKFLKQFIWKKIYARNDNITIGQCAVSGDSSLLHNWTVRYHFTDKKRDRGAWDNLVLATGRDIWPKIRIFTRCAFVEKTFFGYYGTWFSVWLSCLLGLINTFN